MKDDPFNMRLRELGWRQPLTEVERAELSTCFGTHPDARKDWEDEMALNRLLEQVPNAPVASNFTSRVLQTVEREAAGRKHVPRWEWIWRVVVPRVAIAAVVVGAGLFAYHRHEEAQRAALAQSMMAVTNVRSLPSPQILEDFDAIRRLNSTPPADKDLLALMQ